MLLWAALIPRLPQPQDLRLSLLPFQIISAKALLCAYLPKRINQVMSWRSMRGDEVPCEDVGRGGGEQKRKSWHFSHRSRRTVRRRPSRSMTLDPEVGQFGEPPGCLRGER